MDIQSIQWQMMELMRKEVHSHVSSESPPVSPLLWTQKYVVQMYLYLLMNDPSFFSHQTKGDLRILAQLLHRCGNDVEMFRVLSSFYFLPLAPQHIFKLLAPITTVICAQCPLIGKIYTKMGQKAQINCKVRYYVPYYKKSAELSTS